jgi:hypothetical protein
MKIVILPAARDDLANFRLSLRDEIWPAICGRCVEA